MKEKLTIGYLSNYQESESQVFDNADLILIGRRSFDTINFKRELNGTEDIFHKIGNISKKYNAPCFVAIKTDNYGLIKRSVGIFEKGKLLGICDATMPYKGESPSFGYKICKTSIGKIGVAVAKDIKNLDCLKALYLCESDLIINLYADIYDFNMQTLIPSLSYLYGIPIISMGSHGVVASSAGGKIVYASEDKKGKFALSTRRTISQVLVKTYLSD